MTVSIIGAGGWGTALAIQASKKTNVYLWSYLQEETEIFNKERENVYYLPGVKLPDNIVITSNIEEVIGSEIIVFVPPSKYFRNIVRLFKKYLNKEKIICSATKGLEYPSEKRMSQILDEELDFYHKVVVLSGPSHAEEVAKDIPTSIVAASEDESRAKIIQELFSNSSFRIYTNDDVIGVEICASVKNVIAIAAGMLRGLGFGDNTMAALITRGLAEMRRLGLILGAKEKTFAGLAGIGDLIVTCISHHSRNGRVGEQLAKGKNIQEILASTKMVAEGVETVKSIVKYENDLNIEMPISHGVYDVIYNNRKPLEILQELMVRPLKNEYL